MTFSALSRDNDFERDRKDKVRILEKSYNPRGIEERWYEYWVSKNYFKPDPASKGSIFSIVIPPPNITGSLHMGHALNAVLQDILTRWKRMSGYKVLWLPGTDHAGIATQNVVEKQLATEDPGFRVAMYEVQTKDVVEKELPSERLYRHKLGREAFIERVWKWKAEYGEKIIHQLKRLGASCDWSRERFTLDEGLSRAVKEVFVRLYEEGLIYRDNRLINWCPRCHTALSDLEVEHEELEGKLTYIRYPLSDSRGHIIVATTRPETMLGDTAVAVHPDDSRYKDFIGKTVDLPLTKRKIPIISDNAVDPSFGTGAVKVTPAHDFNDEAMAKRQSPALEFITVIGKDGLMTEDAGGRYAGMGRYDCRRLVLKDLKEKGLIEKEQRYTHAIGHCYRCKTVIEPLLTLQWYVDVRPLAKEAIKVVKEGRIRLIPRPWENTYFAWMENIRDWCISRQIWWGHRIPAWYCQKMQNAKCKMQNGVTVSRVIPTICPYCGSEELIQDEDVLDTWFSSALWPFSTLGWPDKTVDLETFYPTTVLVTGFDIIFFWVARMIMMGLKFMGDVPFRDVYIHALVRDIKGQKMSKSKGNVVDPLTMMDRYGTDAFRFTLAAFAAQGRDIKFSEERVEGYRHFVNKLWNAARFITMNLKTVTSNKLQVISENEDSSLVTPWPRSPASLPGLAPRSGAGREAGQAAKQGRRHSSLSLASRWIMSRLAATADDINRALDEYRFNDAACNIYQFVWHEFCDWYIEMAKSDTRDPELKNSVIGCLLYTLDASLRLLHPFMPYVTEEIWQKIPHVRRDREEIRDSIIISEYPKSLPRDYQAEEDMSYIIDAVTGIRTIRGELNISPSFELNVSIKTYSRKTEEILRENVQYLKRLANASEIKIGMEVDKPEGSATCVKSSMEIYVLLKGVLNIEAEIDRLKKVETEVEGSISFLNKKLLDEDFLLRAPTGVVEKEKARYEELIRKKERIMESIKKLKEARGEK
ncbi:MAG: valine--tRNA ligase [Thermodesulfovibrionales bacterium]|nr:valine--tRNA ligase [Thermodesulfovibrionales bacterium]